VPFQTGQRWNPRQSGVCGQAPRKPLFHTGSGPAPRRGSHLPALRVKRVGVCARRAERLWRPNLYSSCSSATAARKPASFGRFRQGVAESRVNWAFAGRHPGNPYSARVSSLGFFIYSTIALQKGVDAGIWLLPAAETLTATVVVVALSAVTASVFLGRLGSQKSIFCVQRF